MHSHGRMCTETCIVSLFIECQVSGNAREVLVLYLERPRRGMVVSVAIVFLCQATRMERIPSDVRGSILSAQTDLSEVLVWVLSSHRSLTFRSCPWR